MWRLEVGPRGPHQTLPLRGFAGLSRLVMGAWQAAYGDRKPSKKQVAVLRELTDRLGAAWVAAHLPADHGDPVAALLTDAAGRRDADLRQAAGREMECAMEKRTHPDEASLAALLTGRATRPEVVPGLVELEVAVPRSMPTAW